MATEVTGYGDAQTGVSLTDAAVIVSGGRGVSNNPSLEPPADLSDEGEQEVWRAQQGFALVPLKIYFSARGFAKIELALAKGKKQYDKRKTIAERQQKKDIDRNLKKYRK